MSLEKITVPLNNLQMSKPTNFRETHMTCQVMTFLPVSPSSGEHQPPLSSDSDTSIIMGMEVGMSEVGLSLEQECEVAKS